MNRTDEAKVEMVARAIYDATHRGLSNCYSWDDRWEDHQEARRDRYLKEAAAAIEALRTTQPDAALREALEAIVQWAESYPLDIFREPDVAACQAALAPIGQTVDAISAAMARHVVKGVGDIARAALGTGAGRGEA